MSSLKVLPLIGEPVPVNRPTGRGGSSGQLAGVGKALGVAGDLLSVASNGRSPTQNPSDFSREKLIPCSESLPSVA